LTKVAPAAAASIVNAMVTVVASPAARLAMGVLRLAVPAGASAQFPSANVRPDGM